MISFFFDIATRKRKLLSSTKVCWKEQLISSKKKNDQDIINDAARGVGLLGDKNRKPRGPTRERKFRKEQWTDLYKQKSDEEFSNKTRINRTTFNLLLNTLWDGLVLTPTNFVPEPTSQTVGSIALQASTRGHIHRLGRRFRDFERIGMCIFQQGNSPYSCLLKRRIREVA